MEQRKDYEQRLQTKIDEWGKEIDQLRTKAEQEEGEQLDLYNTHEQLRSQHARVSKKFADLQSTDESSWEKLKTDLDKELDELGQAIRSSLSKKE